MTKAAEYLQRCLIAVSCCSYGTLFALLYHTRSCVFCGFICCSCLCLVGLWSLWHSSLVCSVFCVGFCGWVRSRVKHPLSSPAKHKKTSRSTASRNSCTNLALDRACNLFALAVRAVAGSLRTHIACVRSLNYCCATHPHAST